jgi:hypothetical protein
MIKKENQVGSKTDKTNVKAQYRSPQLVTYGDIRELTLAGGRRNPDNSRDSESKSGPA